MQCLAIPLASMQDLFEVMRALFCYFLERKKILKKKKLHAACFVDMQLHAKPSSTQSL